jgi:RND superfamily putative drug exporter
VVYLAAVIVVGTLVAMASGKVPTVLALGTGLAILIDATLVRGVLVPAFMKVFGEHSWYAPRLLRRAHARVGLSETAPIEAQPSLQ